MSDLISLLGGIEEYGLILLVFPIVALIWILISHNEKCRKFFKRLIHKSNFGYFVFGLVYLIACIILKSSSIISLVWFWILLGSDLLYLCYCLYSINHLSPIACYYIQKYYRFLREGMALEKIAYFKKNHWYINDIKEKMEFARIKAYYYKEIGRVDLAYKIIDEIKQEDIYEEVMYWVTMTKAEFLFDLGDLSAASKILEDKVFDKEPFRYILASKSCEFASDFDKAFELLIRAKDLCHSENIRTEMIIQVYDSLANILYIQGNLTSAICYLQSANDLLVEKKIQIMSLQKSVKSKLILYQSLSQADKDDVQKLIKDYEAQIPVNSVDNFISFHNCCFEVYRQQGETKKNYDLIRNGYFELIEKLNNSQKALLQASTFEMLINGRFIHDWLDKEVAKSHNDYRELEPQDKIIVYNHFFSFLQQPMFFCIRNKSPYKELYEQIIEYYKTDGIRDVNKLLDSLAPYEIHKYGRLIKDKLLIQKYLQREKHVPLSINTYFDLYDIYNKAGLQMAAIDALMSLADECNAPVSKLIQLNQNEPMILFQDLIDSINNPPNPILLPNGYQLEYLDFQLHDFSCYLLYEDVINKSLDIMIPIVKQWRNLPGKFEFVIHLSTLLVDVNRMQEAKELYDMFCNNAKSIEHYLLWVKRDLGRISKNLNNSFREGQEE